MNNQEELHPLVAMEGKALRCMNSGDYLQAIQLFEDIVRTAPNWDHGQAWCNLAGCYEDIGKIEKARECYLKALQYQPDYGIFLGNYASFLYLHGTPQEAFDAHMKYLKMESRYESMDRLKDVVDLLVRIGATLDMNQDVVNKIIESTIS